MPLLCDEALSVAFDHAAVTCDRLVVASPDYRGRLRCWARWLGLPVAGCRLRLLVLGCGTGASTAALLAAVPRAEVVAVDGSAGMLDRARARAWPHNVAFVHVSAERLAAVGVAGPFDVVFAAYLFRNVAGPCAFFTAVRGLLVVGGRIAMHVPENRPAAP